LNKWRPADLINIIDFKQLEIRIILHVLQIHETSKPPFDKCDAVLQILHVLRINVFCPTLFTAQ